MIYLFCLDQRIRVANRPRGFVRWLAKLTADGVVKAIERQRFAERYAPLSKRYYERKKRLGLSLNFWEATGYLKEHVRWYWSASKKGYVVDFSSEKYPKSGVLLRDVARWLESGTSRVPPRPLFRRVLLDIRRNVIRLRRIYQLSHY